MPAQPGGESARFSQRRYSDLAACQAELDQLRECLRSSPVIEQAKGILMAQQGCAAEEAFGLLVQASQRSNRKLRDVARAVVDNVERRSWPSCVVGSAQHQRLSP